MPLIEMTRQNGGPLAIEPRAVSVLIDATADANVSIARMADGRGLLISGPYGDVINLLDPNREFMVEFVRSNQPEPRAPLHVVAVDEGEDDGIGQGMTADANVVTTQPVRMVAVNPALVGAVFESVTPGQVIIKALDGRGVSVRGSFADVMTKLRRDDSVPAEEDEILPATHH